MGTILGIILLIGFFLVGADCIKEGLNSIGEGSGCGCIFGVFAILIGLGFISTGLGAPIGMIIIALIIIALRSKKDE